MINENCWPPNKGHVACIKKPTTSFNTVVYMLHKHNYAEQKNKSEHCSYRWNRQTFFFQLMQANISSSFFSQVVGTEQCNQL